MSLWLPVLCLYYGKHPQYMIFPFAHHTKSIQFNFHLLKVWHETFLAVGILDKFSGPFCSFLEEGSVVNWLVTLSVLFVIYMVL